MYIHKIYRVDVCCLKVPLILKLLFAVGSSTAGGMELKEKQSVVDPEVSEAVDFEEPKKEALA